MRGVVFVGDTNKTACNVVGVGAPKKHFSGINVVKRILSLRQSYR
jgi:hypothetical protein